MNLKRILCMVLALMMAMAALALAESDDLQAQLDAANARIAELEAQVEKYYPVYESQVVAEYGDGQVVLLQDATPQYQSVVQMYAQYGIPVNQYADQIKQSVLTSMVQQAVIDAKSKELGLDQLDEATMADLNALAAEDMDHYIDLYGSYFTKEDATEEENKEAVLKGLADAGYTQEVMLQERVTNLVNEKLLDHVTESVSITEDEVSAEYDKMVEEAEKSYGESDFDYNSARTSGSVIVWNPEGYRAVKHVLIKFDEDQDERYGNLESTMSALEGELDMLNDPEALKEAKAEAENNPDAEPIRTVEEVEADIGKVGANMEALYAELLPEAQRVIDAFNAGTDFQTLIDDYGDDPGMTQEPAATQGYAVAERSDYWEEAFVKAAMAIPEVGGISEPVHGSNGIHIIYYMADITPGAVPFEEVKDKVEETALNNRKTETFNDQVKAWIEEAKPVYHVDRFI